MGESVEEIVGLAVGTVEERVDGIEGRVVELEKIAKEWAGLAFRMGEEWIAVRRRLDGIEECIRPLSEATVGVVRELRGEKEAEPAVEARRGVEDVEEWGARAKAMTGSELGRFLTDIVNREHTRASRVIAYAAAVQAVLSAVGRSGVGELERHDRDAVMGVVEEWRWEKA